MSDGKKYYCFCGSNCKYETMTKEQILSAIAQATGVEDVEPDAGFISKVFEKNNGGYVTFWVGTQAQYNALQATEENCLYIITDDTTKEDFEKAVAEISAKADEAAAVAADAKTAADDAKTAALASWDYTNDVRIMTEHIDISGAVSFELTTNTSDKENSGINLTVNKMEYVPAAGVVMFNVKLGYGTGLFAAGESIWFKMTGDYKPSTSGGAGSADGVALQIVGSNFQFISQRDFSTSGGVNIHGWYFCDGK